MTEPLDPMLPPEPGSEADRIMRDHRAMEALRRYPINLKRKWPVGWAASTLAPVQWLPGASDSQCDPADAILACAAAIEAASTDSGSS